MKKLIPVIVFISLVVSPGRGFSQTENLLAFNSSKNARTAAEAVTKLDSKFINVKAKRNFARSFGNIANETWFSIPGGFIANFLLDGIDYRITYNDKGAWQYDQLIYSEDKLPFDIRNLIKRQYYDFDIEFCSEFQTHNFSTFIISLNDPKTMRTFKVKVVDGEMEIFTPENKEN